VIGAFRSSYCSVVPASSCSLSGPLLYRSPVVVFFDRGHPCFRNFNSSIPVDAIRVKSYVNSFLDPTWPVSWVCSDLNSQQPSIRLTMEIENNSKIAFLDTPVYREPDGRLTTSVYRKPTHTDQHLAYDLHFLSQ